MKHPSILPSHFDTVVYHKKAASIDTLEDFISKIELRSLQNPHIGAIGYSDVLFSYNGQDYNRQVTFNKSAYTRNILLDNGRVKVVLIGWNSGQSSPLHGHRKTSCILRVLNNQVQEIRMGLGGRQILSSSKLFAGSMTLINDYYGHHIISNPTKTPTATLHIYTY